MAQTDDARTLISDRRAPMEQIYASYANTLKSLANEARKTLYFTKGVEYSPSAAKTYEKEVKELDRKLDISMKNKPRERQAQIIANSRYNAVIQSNPDMDKEAKKKRRQRELTRARDLVGAKRELIDITDREWEAIQAGAITESKLKLILNNTDIDVLRDRATPKTRTTLSPSKINTAKAMSASNYTLEQIAKKLGVSTSTVYTYLNE